MARRASFGGIVKSATRNFSELLPCRFAVSITVSSVPSRLAPARVRLPQQRVGPLGLLIRRMDEQSQRRPAQVRTTGDVATTKFMFGVEDKVHRPSLSKRDRCTNYTLLPGMAQ